MDEHRLMQTLHGLTQTPHRQRQTKADSAQTNVDSMDSAQMNTDSMWNDGYFFILVTTWLDFAWTCTESAQSMQIHVEHMGECKLLV
jgi:hypothetical protein